MFQSVNSILLKKKDNLLECSILDKLGRDWSIEEVAQFYNIYDEAYDGAVPEIPQDLFKLALLHS